VNSSVWGARKKEKFDFFIAELLKPPSGVDAVEHADNGYAVHLIRHFHREAED